MKRNCSLAIMVCWVATLMLASCGDSKFRGYNKTADGLYYKFYQQDAKAVKPQLTDFLKLDMACYLNDTLYYDFRNTGSEVYSQLKESRFVGDMQEAYAMLHIGDSASFYVKADSVAVHYYDQNPSEVGLTPDDYFRYEVKLLEVKTQEAFQADIDQMKQQMIEASQTSLAAYIEREGITVSPDENGIYIVSLEKGTGRSPVKGEKVELDFAAYLLNGQEVGSTFGTGNRFSFVLGENFAIPGWEIVVPQMRLGERVRAIIPFNMAYGERQVGQVPPYSNMVYDIKLQKIITQAELIKQSEEDMRAMKAKSEQTFSDYVKDNHFTECTKNGVYYTKSLITSGEKVEPGQTARIIFEAYYLDGTLLGSSDQTGGTYDVNYGSHSVLSGLEEAIGMLRVGEKGRFAIPYRMAYGENPYGNIPACSNLVFDVELLEIVK